MACGQCQGIESVFNLQAASRELREFRKKGPSKQTVLLVSTIRNLGIQGKTLLDVGGGVGAVQYGLLDAGAATATDVDASTAYLSVAREEATARGYSQRIDHLHGNFVDIAPEIADADIVTMDRVICCYHDMDTLVRLTSAKARAVYGVVYPVDRWWTRLAVAVMNLWLRLSGSPFRTFIHASAEVDALVAASGLQRQFHQVSGFWQVVVYTRP